MATEYYQKQLDAICDAADALNALNESHCDTLGDSHYNENAIRALRQLISSAESIHDRVADLEARRGNQSWGDPYRDFQEYKASIR